jgi:succinate dehydrogenase/fumarate reductase cytochrome b subunit
MNLIGIVIFIFYCLGVHVLNGVRVLGTLYKVISNVIFQYEEEFMD